MRKPLVSVLIPVYNVESYLERCLDSILSQTLKNIEVICVNDGSTDNSLAILEKYKEKDKRIVIISKENGGLPSARNAGIDAARGKYVGFVDSDDFIEPQMYRVMTRAAEENHSDIVICGANIFPEKPRANKWLYDTLSPLKRVYKEFMPEVIFQSVDTTPFLWRTLIRKSLIDSGEYRLDEAIHIGEDKAFQCKIYPAAQGITVLPDKLYNYFWCRPESLMSKVYGDIKTKVLAHVKLVECISTDLSLKTFDDKTKTATWASFCEWSIGFIYNDFISASSQLKNIISKRLISIWHEAGYLRYMHRIAEPTRKKYDYIASFVNEISSNPDLTIITELTNNSTFVNQWLETLETLTDTGVECIIISNGTTQDVYNKVQKQLIDNHRIRLYNSDDKISHAKALNIGLNLSEGKYITFLDTTDWYESINLLFEWYRFAIEKDLDFCPSIGCRKSSTHEDCVERIEGRVGNEISRSGGMDGDYQNALYKKAFLEQNDIYFKDYSVLTGPEFLWESYIKAEKREEFGKSVYVKREKYIRDWIPTEDCELVLDGLNAICDRSLELGNPVLHAKVFSTLNSDKLKNMLVNNILPYNLAVSKQLDGKNSQIKAVSSLFSLMGKADTSLLEKGGYSDRDSIMETIYEVIKSRHRVMDKLG